MREIKFRAYHQGHMYYSDSQEDAGLLGAKVGQSCIAVFFDKLYLRERLMQYTGLKDKNGVEIYEGDILEIKGLPNKALCKWSQKDGGFTYNSLGSSRSGMIAYAPSSDIEVIGSIYENPGELLGE